MLTFNWGVKRFGHAHHYIGAEYPEYVIKKQTAQQNTSVEHFIQLKKLNTVDGKRKAKYVVGNPMLKREREKSESSKILNFALKKNEKKLTLVIKYQTPIANETTKQATS